MERGGRKEVVGSCNRAHISWAESEQFRKERQRKRERYTDTHRDKEGGQMVKRVGAMCEKQQSACVSLCASLA